MTLSTSRVVSSCSNSGFSAPGDPTSASTAVPPRAALGTVAIGWHAAMARAAMATAAHPLRMSRHPDVGDRADEECRRDDPGGPVDLALEAPARPVSTADAAVTASDRPAQSRRLGGLHEHPGHQQHGQDDLDDDQRVSDSFHRNSGILLVALGDGLPVQRVEPGGDIVRALVLVLEVVVVLPYVDAEDRSHPFHVRAVLVGVALDR